MIEEPGVLLEVDCRPVLDSLLPVYDDAEPFELLAPVTGEPEVLLPEEETMLDETAVPLALGPVVVNVNRVKERVPYPYG